MSDRLNEYADKFRLWNDSRIEKDIQQNKKEKGIETFQTFSTESEDNNVQEIQRIEMPAIKSNHFCDDSVKTITVYVLTWWNSIQSQLVIANNKDEFIQFKKWFTNLLKTDCEENGLSWYDLDSFIVAWSELEESDQYSHSELWELLEEENLV